MSKKLEKLIYFIIFAFYMGLLIYLLFFAEEFGRSVTEKKYSYNLVPFKEIKRYIFRFKTIGLKTCIINLGGNIIAFIPFGIFVPYLFKENMNVFLIGIMTMITSLFVEMFQLMLMVGSFDVDDIILNTAGGIIGGIIYVICRKKILQNNSGQTLQKEE